MRWCRHGCSGGGAALLAWSGFAAGCASAPVARSQPPAPECGRVVVEVVGAPEGGGPLRIGMSRAGGWLTREGVEFGASPPSAPRVEVTFEGVPPGAWAVSVFHDRDADEVLTRGAFGLPSEAYGFSCLDPAPLLPPSFQAAAFQVRPGATCRERVVMRGGG